MLKLSIQSIFKGLYRRCECGCGHLIKISRIDGKIRRFHNNHDKKGKLNWNFKNYRSLQRGYYMIYKPHFKCSVNGWVREHRYIMYIYLSILNGKPIYLDENDDIHHKDKNKKNNKIENLELIRHGDHSKHHNPIIDKSNRICNLCGIDNDRHWMNDINGFLCLCCYMNVRYFRKKFSQ